MPKMLGRNIYIGRLKTKKTLKKINSLLRDIMRHPFEGEGKPEHLRADSNNWSRRINDKDRLVYEVENGMITVKQCKGHYSDK